MSDQEPTIDLTDVPRVATWLVQKLCIADQLESIEGDLLELYERRGRRLGLAKARRAFWRDGGRQGRRVAPRDPRAGAP